MTWAKSAPAPRDCILLLLVLFFSSCATYTPKTLSPERSAQAWEARTLADEQLRKFIASDLGRDPEPWPPADGWNLEQLSLAGYYFHPDLDVARAQWHTAKAAAITAGARPNPVISATPGFTTRNTAGVSPWLVSFGLDWPIETAGKRSLRIKHAKQLTQAAQLNLATAAWRVRAGVRDNFAAYRFSNQQTKLLNERLVLQQQQIRLLEQRLANGAVSEFEVAPTRIAIEKTRVELNQAEELRALATERLAASIGIPTSGFAKVPILATPASLRVDDLQFAETRSRALHNRADLNAALMEFEASDTALQLELAKQYPDVHLNPNYEYDQGANKWRLGLSLELPVLNQNQGPIAEARARRDEVAARFIALQAVIISEIDNAAQAVQRADKRRKTVRDSLAAQTKHTKAIAAQVNAGAADAVDLVSAQIERLASVMLELDADNQLEQALGRLEDALQEPVGQRPSVAAPLPNHLEINFREEKGKP